LKLPHRRIRITQDCGDISLTTVFLAQRDGQACMGNPTITA